ncbi:phosphatase PAP2 family protein [Ginsengibacter hankyongi]|uniref:Phosphatase PAP2 family protein n=1 Tax=Ginsengibacter hankyongi TaxID=2607284 RepID=A0A5J5IC47_9BACT|nr:phosphatase PAP2 family protein [Ginsengibacter hankyongi]KAA9034532.1 phosphatase PAP2 family protein [Ginsengibacter hankyongi]
MKKHLVICATFFLISSAFSQTNNTSQDTLSRDSLKNTLINDSSKNLSPDAASLTNLSSAAPTAKSKTNAESVFNKKTNGVLINKNNSPYKTHFVTDGLVITAAVATTLAGYTLIKNKNDLTPAELATKTKDKLPFFDRGIAGNYSTQANKDSYILFDASYVIPVAMIFINKNERTKAGQLITLYVETIGITGAMYTLTAGLVYRSRPFVYGDKAPLDKRLDKGGQRSFYGGHVATTAAATFLTAKIFSDFNPNSKLRPYIWAASGILTASMAYMRMQAGYHFFSDCVLSAAIGTATGILIPSLHKNKNFEKISMAPEMINGNAGMHLTYRF